MGDKSRIEWTDATFNPVTGCTPVSAGCHNCYAARMVKRFPHLHGERAAWGTSPHREPIPYSEICFHPSRLDIPLRWKKPRRIFVSSMGDLFHPDVSVTWLESVLATITLCPQHTFMILSKRPERFGLLTEDRLRISRTDTWPIRNLWLGVTVENQEILDLRWPYLRDTPAARYFISYEPGLGYLFLPPDFLSLGNRAWLICGGETGPGARPMPPGAARSLRNQCTAAGVPFFYKGIGTYAMKKSDPNYMKIDGKEWKEFPA